MVALGLWPHPGISFLDAGGGDREATPCFRPRFSPPPLPVAGTQQMVGARRKELILPQPVSDLASGCQHLCPSCLYGQVGPGPCHRPHPHPQPAPFLGGFEGASPPLPWLGGAPSTDCQLRLAATGPRSWEPAGWETGL